MLPLLSFHATAPSREPGTFDGSAVPCVPYTPVCWTVSAPLTHVQLLPSNFQRSLRCPTENPEASRPYPPTNQRLPPASLHEVEPSRAPGTFAAAAVPCVPSTPAWLTVFAPFTQVQLLLSN